MLSFERLKELKDWVRSVMKFGVSEGSEIIVLIDEAIAHQSVKSEDVQEAIESALCLFKHCDEAQKWPGTYYSEDVKTAITALQAYQPMVRKDRIVEEVAISKTETTSCEWCEIASECEYEVTFFEDGDRCAKHRELMPHYCPNCGRKLN